MVGRSLYIQRKVVLNEEEFQLTDNHVFKPSNLYPQKPF